MLTREGGTAPVVIALLVVLILVAGGTFLFASTQDHGTTYTTTETSAGPTTTVTVPPVTSTATVVSIVTVTSSVVSLAAGTTTTSTTSASCAYTNTSSTGTQPALSQLVGLAQNFTSVSVTFGENTTSGPVLVNDSYLLVETGPDGGYTSYEMAFTETGGPANGTTTAWFLSNGTLLATESAGHNSTGVSASNELDSVAAPFLSLVLYNEAPDILAPLSSLSATSSTVSIGGVNMEVMNYGGRSITPSAPLVFDECFGSSINAYALTTFELQSGVVPGTNFNLLAYLDLQGRVSSSSGSGSTAPFSMYEKVLSFETVEAASMMTDTMSNSMQ
ncbi:MAG: hypothetical protein OK456_08190 [Thaumarchaeota archaeon]|nr:hypothetical protein [Nitrososphaerota archaeon]